MGAPQQQPSYDLRTSILESLEDGVLMVDREGRVVAQNRVASGLLADFERGVFRADGRARLAAHDLPWMRHVRGETVRPEELLVRGPEDQGYIWLQVTLRPLPEGGAIAVMRDVTALRRSEADRRELLIREQHARSRVERVLALERTLEQRLKAVIEASGVVFNSLNTEAVLASLLDLAQKMVCADGYAIWRAMPGEVEWRVACSVGLSTEFQATHAQFSEDALPLSGPIVIEDLSTEAALQHRRELYAAEGVQSLMIIPLVLHGSPRGTLAFYSKQRRRFEELEIHMATALGNLAAAAIGTAELYEEQTRMRARAEESEARASFLAQATAILGSSLDYETTLTQVARLAVPHMADWCTVEMLQPDGSIRQLAIEHSNPARIEWARELRRLYPPDPTNAGGVANVLRTGRSELVAEIPDEVLARAARDSEHLAMLREIGLTSYMCVPVQTRGRVLGAIMFVTAESGRRFGAADLQAAEHLGRRAALAIDNALLYETARKEREAAQESLEASRRMEARFRRLVESGIVGIILGESDRITEANDVFLQLLGYTREELVAGGLRWADLTPAEYLGADIDAQRRMIADGACPPYEKEYLRKDGTRLSVLLGTALLEPPPRVAWVGFVVDLTERKRLEERLREAQKLESIGLLAGGVAHDFNNILTGILGNASLAWEDLHPDHPVRPTLENVVIAAERAADLTRQLLAYSGRGKFVIQPVDVSALVRELLPLLHVSIPKKVELRASLGKKLPPVEADATQLQQLVMNLVINASEAIGDGPGIVRVATRLESVAADYVPNALTTEGFEPGPYILLEVEDTGAVMDAETLPHIFDPFFTTKFTGRGLGLAAALGIVRGHKGDIQVFSAPGRGTTFRVLLPVTAVAKAELAALAPQPEKLRGAGTILLVDDEDVVLEIGKRALKRYGYAVLAARDGREAVDVFRAHAGEVALILLDLTMPVMGGEEAVRHLREIRSDVPIVVSSGYGETEVLRRFGETPDIGFLQKPYTAATLGVTIHEKLGGKAHASGIG